MRIDTKLPNYAAVFDNLHDGKSDRSISGTNDWKTIEIILDIPSNASNIAYGALLVGTGQIWFDNLSFEVVDNSLETTGRRIITKSYSKEHIRTKPTYLDFEDQQSQCMTKKHFISSNSYSLKKQTQEP